MFFKPEGRLPEGSVVLLKDSSKKLMIMGFCQTKPGVPGKIYDYCGCLYPEGYLAPDRIYLFDHDQIDRVYFVGYIDEEQYSFQAVLDERPEG